MLLAIRSCTVAALVGIAAGAATSAADVTILTRSSEVAAYQTFYEPMEGLTYVYNERETFTGMGLWSVDLPHAPAHTDDASFSGISGVFESGGHTQAGEPGGLSETASLVATFSVTGQSVGATLNYSAFGTSRFVGGNATVGNAVLLLTNVDTGAVIFDLYDRTPDAINNTFSVATWNASVWSGTLGVGTYQFPWRPKRSTSSSFIMARATRSA